MEGTTRAKDARNLEEIEELRAIAKSEHESLEVMVRTLDDSYNNKRVTLTSSSQIGKVVGTDGGMNAKRSGLQGISGRLRTKIRCSTPDFWQPKSGRLYKKPKKWLTR